MGSSTGNESYLKKPKTTQTEPIGWSSPGTPSMRVFGPPPPYKEPLQTRVMTKEEADLNTALLLSKKKKKVKTKPSASSYKVRLFIPPEARASRGLYSFHNQVIG